MKRVCQEFEALLLEYLFKEMRKAVVKSNLLDTGWADGFYQDMVFQNLSREISKGPGLGVWQEMMKALKRNQETADNI